VNICSENQNLVVKYAYVYAVHAHVPRLLAVRCQVNCGTVNAASSDAGKCQHFYFLEGTEMLNA
jgi:hypothetical protein